MIGRRPEHDDAGGRERSAEDDRLADGRDAERGGTSVEGGAPDVDRTVPVAVGLDDRPQLGRGQQVAQAACVAADRADVDRDERTGHALIVAGR